MIFFDKDALSLPSENQKESGLSVGVLFIVVSHAKCNVKLSFDINKLVITGTINLTYL